MAASTSSASDEKKKIRKMSLSYLKNTFQKKSPSSMCAEAASNVGDVLPEDTENFDLTDDLRSDRVTESSTECNSEKSFRDTEHSETSKDKPPGFFRNIKKRLHIRDLRLCKSKQKIKAIESASPSYGLTSALDVSSTQLPLTFFNEKKNCESDTQNGTNIANGYLNNDHESSHGESTDEDDRLQEEPAYVSSGIASIAGPQTRRTAESGEISPDSESSNEKKFNLTEELLKLSKYGWYWGPISRDEADTKLANEPDGAFLVRDSSADKYLLTLSFKSSGKLLHTRVEHSGGLFSLYYHPECKRFSSVVALINHSMSFSQSAVYCYSRPRYPGHPAFPVRLTKPVSRFTQVRSLQYLCRFVIRQNTRVDNIDKLPLPDTIRGYIEEAHY